MSLPKSLTISKFTLISKLTHNIEQQFAMSNACNKDNLCGARNIIYIVRKYIFLKFLPVLVIEKQKV